MDVVFESKRLLFRKMVKSDFQNLCPVLQDKEVMYAWEHAFTDEEVNSWIDKNLERYSNEGYSYFAVIEKDTDYFIGVMGPLIEQTEAGEQIGIGYILNKQYWGKGYAVEGARASLDYAFQYLNADRVIAHIRPNNLPSRKVAEKLGMEIEGEYIKHYKGKEMLHLIYSRGK
ncbi:GNAT family N-acetyltransferase [Anaerospora sp.]|uniref:GNAT family N-acetyltransferase n=1 Tax=Anaerospora sp. TaxID=1960278 RepID=UPI00289DF7C2|nr:GNAT family N-acetyltransferase [Anaerospora sp.]MDF2930032.1 acetyltransferase, family [Anaerospora sp.]